jgi:hypothetical protein
VIVRLLRNDQKTVQDDARSRPTTHSIEVRLVDHASQGSSKDQPDLVRRDTPLACARQPSWLGWLAGWL